MDTTKRRKPAAEKKSSILCVKLTRSDHDLIRAAAGGGGRVGAWVRPILIRAARAEIARGRAPRA